MVHFNSTLVRLKASNSPLPVVACGSFQFHFGTIESLIDSFILLSTRISIPLWYDWKVRGEESFRKRRDFNSTLVRLKGIYSACVWYYFVISIPLWYDWKSHNFLIKQVTSLFQFHFGTIERVLACIAPLEAFWFQFHFGTIESLRGEWFPKTHYQFQFHFGTIESWFL